MSDMNYDETKKQYPQSPEPFIGGEISGRRDLPDELRENLGSRRVPKLSNVRFPDADPVVAKFTEEYRQYGVDILFVNPPSPDGGIWIRSQHRVGRRSRENMIWGQVRPRASPPGPAACFRSRCARPRAPASARR